MFKFLKDIPQHLAVKTGVEKPEKWLFEKNEETGMYWPFQPIEDIDFFDSDYFELIPKKVVELFKAYDERVIKDYPDTFALLEKVKKLGWTFEYYLDNEPYNLQPLEVITE